MKIAANGIWTGTGEPAPGRLSISEGRIEALLPPGEADLDLGDTILCAGFVNAHVHLDLSLPRPTETMESSFDDWLRSVVETRRNLGDDGITMAATCGGEEALASGTTALFDIDPAGHSIAALTDSPLRRLILREVISLQAQPGPDLTAIQSFLGGSSDPAYERRGLSPHSSYTVHPEVLRQLLPLCRELGSPWAMHVAEPTWERDLLVNGHGEGARFLEGFGANPDQFCRSETMIESLLKTNDLTSHGLVIHGNECSQTELAAIGESGSALVWCPRSHAFFGRPTHPAPEATRLGVPVLLGTDGKVSAGTLSMLDEMRCAAASVRETTSTLDATDIWQMATINPRKWLAGTGHGDFLGSGTLKAGDPADLVAVSIPQGKNTTLEKALEKALDGQVIGCWIDGRALSPEPLPDQ